MIDPLVFLAKEKEAKVIDPDVEDFEGSFGCPEQGCYETTTLGKFNKSTREITWTCINGHNGRANL